MKIKQNKITFRKNISQYKKIFFFIGVFVFVLILSTTITTIKSFDLTSKEERLKKGILILKTEIGELEARYFDVKNLVSQKDASEFGLRTPDAPIVYVNAKSFGKVSLNR
jgi:hypothetical protein